MYCKLVINAESADCLCYWYLDTKTGLGQHYVIVIVSDVFSGHFDTMAGNPPPHHVIVCDCAPMPVFARVLHCCHFLPKNFTPWDFSEWMWPAQDVWQCDQTEETAKAFRFPSHNKPRNWGTQIAREVVRRRAFLENGLYVRSTIFHFLCISKE